MTLTPVETPHDDRCFWTGGGDLVVAWSWAICSTRSVRPDQPSDLSHHRYLRRKGILWAAVYLCSNTYNIGTAECTQTAPFSGTTPVNLTAVRTAGGHQISVSTVLWIGVGVIEIKGRWIELPRTDLTRASAASFTLGWVTTACKADMKEDWNWNLPFYNCTRHEGFPWITPNRDQFLQLRTSSVNFMWSILTFASPESVCVAPGRVYKSTFTMALQLVTLGVPTHNSHR